MPIPDKAVTFPSSADPYDLVEWICECGDKILEADESVDDFTLVLDSAAVALGVEIKTLAPYEASIIDEGRSVQFWMEVDNAFREDAAFATGFQVGITLSIDSDSIPPRRRQRTWVATLEQQ